MPFSWFGKTNIQLNYNPLLIGCPSCRFLLCHQASACQSKEQNYPPLPSTLYWNRVDSPASAQSTLRLSLFHRLYIDRMLWKYWSTLGYFSMLLRIYEQNWLFNRFHMEQAFFAWIYIWIFDNLFQKIQCFLRLKYTWKGNQMNWRKTYKVFGIFSMVWHFCLNIKKNTSEYFLSFSKISLDYSFAKLLI